LSAVKVTAISLQIYKTLFHSTKSARYVGAFQIVALNNPVGIIRSVENTNGVPLWHPVGMHPYGMPTATGTLPFLPSDSFLRNEQKRQFEMHPKKSAKSFFEAL
jgi:hypothetical protein